MKRTFLGNGSVWDAKNGKNLCTFVDGKVTTEDKHTAEILVRRGNKEVTAKSKVTAPPATKTSKKRNPRKTKK